MIFLINIYCRQFGGRSIETYFFWYYLNSTVLSGNIPVWLELEPEPK